MAPCVRLLFQSGRGEKKNFPSEDSPCVKDFPLFASKQGGGCWNITFDRFESDRPRITRPNGA